MEVKELSKEQQQFIQYAIEGHNILVDACIGSGKTTAIQTLCGCMKNRRILYLTYNKLLKLDAQNRIQNGYVTVTNYHGFAYQGLLRINAKPGLSELIQVYNRKKPPCGPYDTLILDEYQDIDQEISEMLLHIKESCPNIQIIAVGDMEQKIYDKTCLDVQAFITEFLGNYIPMEFTACFRINKLHAAMLGRIWNKKIAGMNESFKICTMNEPDIRKTVSRLKPGQLLVLGSKGGDAQNLQNYLESKHRDTFNKKTLWSKITDTDGSATSPTPGCAIFTTYDGSKGMEREVCVLYDWSVPYWEMRLSKPDTRYEILRNIFCVAASRAKKLLILASVDSPLSELDLSTPSERQMPYRDMAISEMFDYKHVEDVEAAYDCLSITELAVADDVINVPVSDELIDLSPCIGHFQEAMFFENYDIDQDLEYSLSQPNRSYMRRPYKKYTLDQKLLYLTAIETKQQRYMNQVKSLPISEENRERIRMRLASHFRPDACVQQPCSITFSSKAGRPLFSANGIMDVVEEGIIYELKFTSALSHVHALQLGMYLACNGFKKKGRLFNVRTGQMLEITVPDPQKFMDKVARAVTKRKLKKYY